MGGQAASEGNANLIEAENNPEITLEHDGLFLGLILGLFLGLSLGLLF